MALFLNENLITRIKELFSEDQIAALEYQQGVRHMTIEKQLEMLYGRLEIKRPYHLDEELFLDKWALTIMDNCHIIEKIKRIREIAIQLANPQTFSETQTTSNVGKLDGKNRGIKNLQKAYETLAQGKDRAGGTLRSEDYDNIEKLIDLEDQKISKTSIEISLKPIDHTSELRKARYDSIGQVKISEENKYLIVPESEEKLKQELEEIKEQISDMPTFNTLQTGISRNKVRNTGIDSSDNFLEYAKDTSSLNVTNKYAAGEAIIRAHEADIHNWRKLFWNKFRFFFESYAQRCQ